MSHMINVFLLDLSEVTRSVFLWTEQNVADGNDIGG